MIQKHIDLIASSYGGLVEDYQLVLACLLVARVLRWGLAQPNSNNMI